MAPCLDIYLFNFSYPFSCNGREKFQHIQLQCSLSILLTLGFIMPYFKWNWITELMIVIFYFPLIVSLEAGSTLTFGRKLSVSSGKISYPLYMTHYAAIWMFSNYYTINKPTGSELFLIVFIGTILLVAFAYLIMLIYDIPVRKYLTKKRLQKQ